MAIDYLIQEYQSNDIFHKEKKGLILFVFTMCPINFKHKQLNLNAAEFKRSHLSPLRRLLLDSFDLVWTESLLKTLHVFVELLVLFQSILFDWIRLKIQSIFEFTLQMFVSDSFLFHF